MPRGAVSRGASAAAPGRHRRARPPEPRPPPAAGRGRRAVAVHRDPPAGFARERESPNLRDRRLLAVGEVHERHAVLVGTARARVRLRITPVGGDGDCRPLRVGRERCGATAALAHWELPLLGAGRRTNDHFGIALQRRHAVREPLAVRRHRGPADRAETQNVFERDGLLGRILRAQFGQGRKRDERGRKGQHRRKTQTLHDLPPYQPTWLDGERTG